MRRRYKLLAVLVAAPALLVLVAAVVLPLLADSEHYKRQVIALVREQTGLALHIDGKVGLRLLPRLRLTATHLRLANPPGFGSGDLARLPWLAVDVKVLPLLAGRIETGAMVLTGLGLNLERDAAGRGNWQAAPAQDQPGASEPLAALAIGELDIRDASLHWRDPANDEVTRVSAINLHTGALRAGHGIDDVRLQLELPDLGASLEARGNVTLGAAGKSLAVPDLRASFQQTIAGMPIDATLNARLAAEFAQQRLTLDDLRLSARGAASDRQRLALELTTALAFDLARQRLTPGRFSLEVSDYALSGNSGEAALTGVASGDLRAATYAFEQLEGSGKLSGTALGGSTLALAVGGTLNADFERDVLSARRLELAGTVDGDGLPFRLVADLEVSPRARTLAASEARLSIQDWRVDGAMTVRSGTAPPALEGVLDLRIQDQPVAGSFAIRESMPGSADLRLDLVAELDIAPTGYNLRGRHALALRAKVHPPSGNGWRRIEDLELGARLSDSAYPGGELTIKLQANVEVNSDDESLRSDDLRISVDDSRIVGSVRLQHFDNPTLRIDLQADRIDADRYLLPGEAAGSTAPRPLGASMEALRGLDFEGEVRVRELIFKGLHMQDVRLTSGAGAQGG